MTTTAPSGVSRHDDTLPACVIALGASAGGVDALSAVVRGLPEGVDAAVLVVLHVSPRGPSVLPEILERVSGLPCRHAADGDRLTRGHIYVAPPDRHLVIRGDTIHVTDGPKENGVRPAVDVLFRSIALSYGARAIGVVLSGMLDDGTAGTVEIGEHGGTVVVQDPDSAMFPAMPFHAAPHATPGHVLPLEDIGPNLGRIAEALVRKGRRGSEMTTEPPQEERPSEFTCPDCGGTLFVEEDGRRPLHFRCRVGHAYSPDSLAAGKDAAIEAALWAAIVALEERGDLSRRLHRRLSQSGTTAERYLTQAGEAEEHAILIRELLASIRREDGAA